jgi:hypothetical protein
MSHKHYFLLFVDMCFKLSNIFDKRRRVKESNIVFMKTHNLIACIRQVVLPSWWRR